MADDAPDGAAGTYRTDRGTVIYDVDNPLAWVESTLAVPPRERV
jgi:hypothetical protein